MLLTVLIVFLWRPNRNNKRYAFSAQIPQEEQQPEEKDEELSGDVQLKGLPTSEMDRGADTSDDNAGGSGEGDSYDTDQLDQLVL